MSEITDVNVLEGDEVFDFSCIVIEAEFARKALASKELPLFVSQALAALELSGRTVAVLREESA
jgi:hypothetical protein